MGKIETGKASSSESAKLISEMQKLIKDKHLNVDLKINNPAEHEKTWKITAEGCTGCTLCSCMICW